MRLGTRILAPQLLLLALLAAFFLTLVHEVTTRRADVQATRARYELAAQAAARIGRIYAESAVDVLAYRLQRRPEYLAAATASSEEARQILAGFSQAASDPREQALLQAIEAAQARLVASRTRLVRAVEVGSVSGILGAFEPWQIHRALLNAYTDDLIAFTEDRYHADVIKGEQEARRVVYVVAAGLLAAIAMVVANAIHVRRSASLPLGMLAQAIEAFGRGEPPKGLGVLGENRTDEIGAVARNFSQMAAQLTELREGLERRVRERTAQLVAANKELEAFSYSASHDLRAPLQTIDGFSRALEEDYADRLDDEGKDFLRRVRAASQHMAQLIDDLLKLSRMSRAELALEEVDLGALARGILGRLQAQHPERQVTLDIADGLTTSGDRRLLTVALENLCGNAWKFTAQRDDACITVGSSTQDGERVFFIRDNGAGFDMARSDKLFVPFQRLHTVASFPGTGIGLATVRRILQRHGGRIWAEAAVDQGACFSFTIPPGAVTAAASQALPST